MLCRVVVSHSSSPFSSSQFGTGRIKYSVPVKFPERALYTCTLTLARWISFVGWETARVTLFCALHSLFSCTFTPNQQLLKPLVHCGQDVYLQTLNVLFTVVTRVCLNTHQCHTKYVKQHLFQRQHQANTTRWIKNKNAKNAHMDTHFLDNLTDGTALKTRHCGRKKAAK